MHFNRTISTSSNKLWGNIIRNKPFTKHEEKFKRYFVKPTKINEPKKVCGVQKALPAIMLPACGSKGENGKISNKKTFWSDIIGSELLIKVTDHNIEKIIRKHKAILIIFYGTWCSVCKDVNVEIGKAAKLISPEEGALGVCDAMENVKAVDMFLIAKTPSFKYFRNGIYIADYIGRPLAKDIIYFMKSHPKCSICAGK